jgi:hypothetical protein
MLDGKVKRVRASIALAPYSEYPYKGTKADLERLRQKFHEKITSVLVSVNRENAVAGTQTLGEFIERSYFPRLDWRLSVPAGNELHIEPFTMKGYKDIWIADVPLEASSHGRLLTMHLSVRIRWKKRRREGKPKKRTHSKA